MKTIILASPNQYGYFTIYYNYAKYLSKEVKVVYICFDQGENRFDMSGNVKVVYIPLSRNKFLNIFKYYREIVRIYNGELSATVILKYYYFSSILNIFIPGNDLLLDVRTGYISTIRVKTYFFNLIIRIESLLFKRIITLSESLRRKLKLSIQKTTIISLGADYIGTAPKKSDKISLLYIGTLTTRNIGQTVEGLSLFLNSVKENIEIKYHIVGGGKPSDVKELNDTINRFNLQRIVQYEGPVYGEKLKMFLMNCNIGVSYIPIIEDYDCQPGTKTIEYLMAGMPVLATETYENKRIVSDCNGILIQDNPLSFADGLRKIISVKDKYDNTKIIDSVKEYSFKCIIDSKLKPLLFSK